MAKRNYLSGGLRSCGRQVELASREAALLERELAVLVEQLSPQLLSHYGVGPITAAQLLVSWSHPGRLRSEAAFARLARRSPDPLQLRQDHPPPPRPRRRPPAQPRPAHDRAHPPPRRPTHNRLHPPTHQRRQDRTRSDPLAQTLHRPQPLPTTRTRLTRALTNIEASPDRFCSSLNNSGRSDSAAWPA